MDQKVYEKSVYTVAQVAKMLGINRNLAYELARRGELPALRLGRRFVCPKVAIDRMLQEPGESLNPAPKGGRDGDRK
jgi:excisionase family DNA binding protein